MSAQETDGGVAPYIMENWGKKNLYNQNRCI